jgi:hypothetical protein
MHEVALRLLLALLGRALIAGGIALAINLRGVSTWHAKKSIESLAWMEAPRRRIPPWKSLLRRPLEDRVRNQVMLTRFISSSPTAAQAQRQRPVTPFALRHEDRTGRSPADRLGSPLRGNARDMRHERTFLGNVGARSLTDRRAAGAAAAFS